MIQSMTGYGKAVVAFKEKKINVEVKSLNSGRELFPADEIHL